jgi:protein-S-isoprenylcysteine O-methyltransferase Ste14
MNDLTGSFIALCWGIFLVLIIVWMFSAKRVAERDRRWVHGWIILVPAVAAFFLVKHETLLPALRAGMVRGSSAPMVGICADAIVLAGLVFALWARVELGRNWNLNPSIQENHELIERGPYVYVRHPMYSGLVLMLLGTVIWYGRWVGAIVFVASLVGTWLKLRAEERLLIGHFGTSYLKYKERVKALIPFIF